MKNMSPLYAIYMVTAISCTCTTLVGMFVDVHIHMDDLGHVMTNIRVSIGFTNVLWMFFYCRYDRNLYIILHKSQESV